MCKFLLQGYTIELFSFVTVGLGDRPKEDGVPPCWCFVYFPASNAYQSSSRGDLIQTQLLLCQQSLGDSVKLLCEPDIGTT